MAETDNLEDLPSAPFEVATVKKFCSSLGLRPTVLSSPSYSDVREYFFDCGIFHFAGHGHSDLRNPLASCLCLKDWADKPLTADRLTKDFRLYGKAPFLAFLSACLTGAIEQSHLVDKGPHLIGVFQLSGFRHVIGSLSPVPDLQWVEMATNFYETLRKEGLLDWAVCCVFYCVMMSLRREIAKKSGQIDREGWRDGRVPGYPVFPSKPIDYFFWVPYVHFGV